MRIRLLPATIATATLFLAVKMVEVVRGTEALISSVSAQQQDGEKKDEGKKEEAKKEDSKKEDTKKEDPKKEDAKKDEAKKEEPKKDEAKSGEKSASDKKSEKDSEEKAKEGEAEGEGKEKEKKNPAVSDTPGDLTGRHFSQAELDLLQNLSRRREELDRWERNIEVKEAALTATEKRIGEKIEQIESMKKIVADLLSQYNTQEDAKLKSLVKIYESMKPDEAARVFEEVEMPVLLLIIDKMSEKKAAPILARMNPKKAKQITVELAEQRRISTTKINDGAKPLVQ